MFHHWLRLSKARAEADEWDILPWDSLAPSVREAWNELTAPGNLELLEERAKTVPEMNHFAATATFKALETCKARS